MSKGLGPAPLLRQRDFRFIWLAGALAGVMRWLEVPVVGLWVYQATESPLQVSLVLFLRLLPNLLFGAVTGAVADRFNRKNLFLAGLLVLSIAFIALGLLAFSGALSVWHVALGVFVSGCFWSTEFPVRRNLLGELAGISRLGTAMGLDAATTNATRMAGPLAGGLLFEMYGIQGTYFFAAVLFTASAILVLSASYRAPTAAVGDWRILSNVLDGLRFVRSSRTIRAVLLLTLVMNVFALPYQTMVPVIGRSTLSLDPFGVGMLFAAEGLGALVAALLIAYRATPRYFTRIYLGGSVLFSASVLMFSLCGSYAASLPLLLIAGLGFAAFGSMQGTLVFACSPPRYRRRVSGVLAVSIGSAPVGILHLGLLAEHLGAATAVAVSQFECLLALAAVAYFVPALWTSDGGRAMERELAESAAAEG